MQTFDRKAVENQEIIAFLYRELTQQQSKQNHRLALLSVLNQSITQAKQIDLARAHKHLSASVAADNTEELINAAVSVLESNGLIDSNGKLCKHVIDRIKPQLELNKKRVIKPTKQPFVWTGPHKMGLRIMSNVSDRQLSLITPQNQPDAFRAVNYWQSTAFKINPAFKEIQNWQAGFEQWQLATLAHDYKGEFYFPTTFDSRTRNYYLSAINPSNTGDNKGIFRFAEKKSVGKEGLRAIRIHLANLMGVKGSLDTREDWAVKNGKDIYPAIKGKSLQEIRNQLGFKKVIQLYAVAKEYRTILARGTKHQSGMILNQDASCSGIQISSTILRNPELARLVNLFASSPDMEPEDLYSTYTDQLKKVLPAHWQAALTRGLAKPAVMYSCYGAGKQVIFYGDNGLIAYLIEHKHTQLAAELAEDEALQEIFWSELCKVIAANLVFVNAIRKAIANHGDNPITWLTYDRLPVSQHPRILDDSNYDVLQLGGKKHIRIRNNTPELIDVDSSIRKQQTSLPVHIPHSLDATHMRITANKAQDNNIAMVHTHDDVGTHAATYWQMKRLLAESFHELHSTDVLQSIQKRNKIKVNIQKGSYDLNECLNSSYMFS